jgi:hypothetical protein
MFPVEGEGTRLYYTEELCLSTEDIGISKALQMNFGPSILVRYTLYNTYT